MLFLRSEMVDEACVKPMDFQHSGNITGKKQRFTIRRQDGAHGLVRQDLPQRVDCCRMPSSSLSITFI